MNLKIKRLRSDGHQKYDQTIDGKRAVNRQSGFRSKDAQGINPSKLSSVIHLLIYVQCENDVNKYMDSTTQTNKNCDQITSSLGHTKIQINIQMVKNTDCR